MFSQGLEKIAKIGEVLSAAGKGLAHGLSEAGGHTVKDTLKLRGARESLKDLRAHKAKDLFTTAKGSEALGKAIGKSAPSTVMGAAYAYGGSKLYSKMKSDTNNGYDQAQNSQYYYR
jgi:hypothetical protein